MKRSMLAVAALVCALPTAAVGACAAGTQPSFGAGSGGGGNTATSSSATAGKGSATSTGGPQSSSSIGGFDPGDANPFDPDASCATAAETAQVEILPVDIIWVVDNSGSMGPAIDQITAGLNAFANLIASKSLDYKVIMLSLRSKTNPVGGHYGVCIPQPLAGDDNCGNGPRFFHSSMDISSTQTLEFFLGTLAQTSGYQPGDAREGEPWAQALRAGATKTIVVVSDDNSRFTADQFEHFPGGPNPNNSSTLPPGILEPVWNGIFDNFTFSGIYGYGSDTDPNAKCTFTNGTPAAASGITYTDLVTQTNGVRAHICDGAPAWNPFFDAVAQAVQQTAKLSCNLTIPPPSTGTIDPKKINVGIVTGSTTTSLFKVPGAADCDTNGGGWYYDDDIHPTTVILCPTSCDLAQTLVGGAGSGSIEVIFGCETIGPA